jgi:RHS repeat-associated protein
MKHRTQTPPPPSLLTPASVHTAYDSANRTLATWGATYPVAYEYDNAGRMIAMYTYRGTGEITDYASIVSLKPQMDRTQWLYDQATGLLTNKLYADGKGPSYSYTALGQLATRKWARLYVQTPVSAPLQTLYKYDSFGALTNTAYSDGTPSVSFTFDALGRQKVARTFLSATGAIISSTTNIYSGLDLIAEIQNGVRIDSQVDAFGRPKGLAIGTDYAVDYGFDEYGRFKSVQSAQSVATNLFTYSYLPSSHLISGYTATQPVSSFEFQVSKSYEPNRDLITTVSNKFGSTTISAFGYENDGFGRRTARTDTTPTLTVNNAFGYNLKSEVTSATMGENAYNYDYDSIGNRVQSAFNAETNTYSANALNQYSSINPINPVNPVEEIIPSYDYDGNMVTNGVWSYTWDGENRLTAVYSNDTLLVSNVYDHQSRRIAKIISRSGAEAQRRDFVYDGWNLLQELITDNGSRTTNSFTWGLDLSGSLQGAGGVGGLLALSRDNTAYFPCFDANGNVTEYIDATGNIRAHYAFDAFGNTISQSGDLASTFSHRFSTKYFDPETGLYYYGYRYYSPELGRWVNRDYIIEAIMDNNLYCSMKNGLINQTDYLGLITIEDSKTVTDDVTSLTDAGLLVDTYYIYKSLPYGFYTETPLLQLKVSVAIDASLNKSIPNVPSTENLFGSDAKVPAFIGAWMNIEVIILDQKALNCFCGMKEGETAKVGWRQFKYSFSPEPQIPADDNSADGWWCNILSVNSTEALGRA